jgi:hypothetical protein
MTLNGRQVDVTTNWQVTSGDHQVRVDSLVECRMDKVWDDNCGWAGAQPWTDYSTYGQFTDTFYLDQNGKFFFNLHYAVDVQGASVDPNLPDGSLDAIIGTTHRIKCSDSRVPYFCEMA